MKTIACTCSIENDRIFLRPRYITVLLACAAKAGVRVLPVILPPETCDASLPSLYAAQFDGFLFTGGDDVAPARYGETVHEKCGVIEPARDAFELALLPAVIATGKPALGICRGIQVMNVALGGSLWQDIHTERAPGAVHCFRDAFHVPRHAVTTAGFLRTLTGCHRIVTNSYHHQSVKRLGTGLSVAAVSSDGLIEAIEYPSLPYYRAVQWHPEMQPDAISQALFADFFHAL